MWAGKTSKLLAYAQAAELIGKKILMIKSEKDTRYSTINIVSHDLKSHQATTCQHLTETILLATEAEIILIDELHFFDDIAEYIPLVATPGTLIIATGLISGENMKPLQNTGIIVALADNINLLKSNCANCSLPTTFTKRKRNLFSGESPVGGADLYEPRCRNCYLDLSTSITTSIIQHATYSINLVETNSINLVETISQKEQQLFLEQENLTLHKAISQFWGLEHIGVLDDPNRNDDDIALEAFRQAIRRTPDGRYICSWPWKEDKTKLPSNFLRCLGRLKSTLRRLNKDPQLFERYEAIFNEQLSLNIIEKVTKGQRDGHVHYIPHQNVQTPQKTTTTMRIVFDASCKTVNGKSLNDCLFRGPVLLPELIGMLLRFRSTPIPLLSDVEKAFLMLELDLSDRDSTRFLWIKDPSKPAEGENLIIYRFARIPFGFISSPFLLAGTIDHHLLNYPHPLAQLIRRNTYVDNILIECNSPQQAIESYHESKRIFADAKMNLREYQCNDPTVKNFLIQQNNPVSKIVKVLGIPWDTENDYLFIPELKQQSNNKTTKREVLKIVASFFDPLGIICPILTQAKLFIQTLWKDQKGWDEELNENNCIKWKNLLKELIPATQSKIPRKLCTQPSYNLELHIFSDASFEAYGAVAYLLNKEKSETSFIIGKVRIRPIKDTTIPRLELLGTLIASILAKNILKELSSLTIKETTIWTDSTIAISWLNTKRTLPVFVRNRVSTFWRNCPSAKIRHVPTKDNPADCATRTLTANELKNSLWLTGPPWLNKPKSYWPKILEIINEPIKEVETETFHTMETSISKQLIEFERFSKWPIVINTIIIILTFLQIKFAKLTPTKNSLLQLLSVFTPKSNNTIKFITAENIAFRLIQESNPPNQKRIKELELTLDSFNTWKCTTRLCYSELHPDAKKPIYLPKAYGTKLYILHVHRLLLHAPTSTTLSTLRLRVWIPQARQETRKTIKNLCLSCRTPKPFELAKFPQFPSSRIIPKPPFQCTGLDYGGPFQVRLTKSESTKTWICLFTCFVSRAIHLELVFDISTFSFLQALRRFISRRGAPAEVWSDNATHFKAADRTIIQAWAESQENQQYLSSHGIKWNFITEASPWQGGVWERMMGLTKKAIHQAIGRKQITMPEMITVLTEIEAVINSRPLTYVPADEATQIIRPIDCIQPGARIGVPLLEPWETEDPTFEPTPSLTTKIIDLWRKQQTVLNKFWELWSSEYLLSLKERQQMHHKQSRSTVTRKPIPGEIVIVSDEGTPRGKWRLGKIIEIIKPTKIKVQLTGKNKHIINRSPKALYPLELNPNIPPESVPFPTPESTEEIIPAPRRSNRIKAMKARTYFIILNIIFFILPMVEAENVTCNANNCAPWNLECCTTTQRTGLIIWAIIIISMIPSVIILLKIGWFLLQLINRLIKIIFNYLFKRFNIRPNNKKQAASRRTLTKLLRRTRNISVALVLLYYISITSGCTELAHMSVDNQDCSIDDETNIETCILKKAMQISIRPMGESTCIQLTTPSNNTEIMKIKTLSLNYYCVFRYWYYTRDYSVDVESVHRCRNAEHSTCFNDWCENVKGDSKVNEFSKSVQSSPGYSHCTRSCQCIGCGQCFLCSPSCLFWRLYATPKSEHNYAVGNCPTWNLEAKIEINFQNQTTLLDLHPATPIDAFNNTFTLQSATTPNLPILGAPFIFGAEVATVSASAPGQPVAGTIGTMQCSDRFDGFAFRCTFPSSICECVPSKYETSCSCNYVNPETIFTSENKLPLNIGPLNIHYTNDTLTATVMQQSSILLHVNFNNVNISALTYLTKCQVAVDSELEGCHSCQSGASTSLNCISRLQTTLDIQCDANNQIQIPCDNQTHSLTIYTTKENYQAVCNYTCSKKTHGNFTLHGTLSTVTIVPPSSQDIGQPWWKPATSIPFENIMKGITDFVINMLKSIIDFALSNPIIVIIIILIIFVTFLIIKKIVFPYVLPAAFPEVQIFSQLAKGLPKPFANQPKTRTKTHSN